MTKFLLIMCMGGIIGVFLALKLAPSSVKLSSLFLTKIVLENKFYYKLFVSITFTINCNSWMRFIQNLILTVQPFSALIFKKQI